MSKISPFRRTALPNKDHWGPQEEGARLTEKSRMGKSWIDNTPQRRPNDGTYQLRITQRKRNENHLKVQTLLDQNKYLLLENSQLSQLVAQRGKIILSLQEKLEQQMNQEVRTLQQIQFQKNRFIQQFHQKSKDYDHRIQNLLDQIGKLHQEIYRQQLIKEDQINQLKNYYSIQHKRQVQQLIQSHTNSNSILQLQIAKLKEICQFKDNSITQLQQQYKNLSQKSKLQINTLNDQINHLNHMKKLQLSQQKINFQNIILNLNRQFKKQIQILTLNYQMEIKKHKHQIQHKNQQIQQLENNLEIGRVQNQTKSHQLVQKKTQLQSQLLQLQQFNKIKLFRQKQNLKSSNQSELQAINANHQAHILNLQAQINKLKELNQTKKRQVERLYEQIRLLRASKDQQYKDAQKIIEQLKQRLLSFKQQNIEDQQAFKTKMAHLHHADIESLKNYYENQLAILTQDLQNRQQVIRQNRQKVHKQIQDKTQLRKIFQSQVAKLKIRIGQLQVKLATVTSQRRQQHASMNSKIQLTSMNLVRQTNQKQKITLFYDQQRRKLQTLIESKDNQIQQLTLKINQLKQDHIKQIKQKDQNIQIIIKKCQNLQLSLKKQQAFYQSQLRKKQAVNQSDKRFYQQQIQRLKRQHMEEYSQGIKNLTKQKTLLETQRNQLRIKVKQMNDTINLLKQHKQLQGMDKDITLQQQKQRLLSQKNLLQVSLKNYYQKQLENRKKQIKDLGQQLRQKQQDIRQMTQKYQKLDKKLNLLLQSQQKLRDIQNKVMSVGQDNNTIKNLAQILRNRRKV